MLPFFYVPFKSIVRQGSNPNFVKYYENKSLANIE